VTLTENYDRREKKHLLLIDPVVRVRLPLRKPLREPQSDLVLSRFNRVRTVADVSSNIDGIVTADSARGRIGRLGGTKHNATSLDSSKTLPDHADDRTGAHVIDQTSKESLGRKISIVSLKKRSLRLVHLQGGKLESLFS
jgi:hypothetical protein